MGVDLHIGDSRAVLPTMAADSFHACVTDPPYALVSIGKRFGADSAAPAKSGKSGVYARASSGFMGQKWDTGETAFDPAFWREVYRVLKPGAHLLAFSGTRTYHRMACAIEDAGFEIRDCIFWAYGSGFPKSHDVSKGIDRANGDARPVVGKRKAVPGVAFKQSSPYLTGRSEIEITSAASAASAVSAAWDGWGTALKPACEPIAVARKPLVGTVAANVMQHSTGALNIDACRVEFVGTEDAAAAAAAIGFYRSRARGTATQSNSIGKESRDGTNTYDPFAIAGRWPANLVHDGSDEVVALFPQSDAGSGSGSGGIWSESTGKPAGPTYGDGVGSAARFFYTAKADANDRLGSKHPTVKPLALMRWLVRLVTPPGGLILDPFAGTGTTGIAAKAEGFNATLIEREESFAADIRIRLDHADGKGALTASLKARNKPKKELNEGLFA